MSMKYDVEFINLDALARFQEQILFFFSTPDL